jgi:hypothetical protein
LSHRCTPFLLAVALLGAAGTRAAAAPNAVNACSMLARVVQANHYWWINLTRHSFVPSAGRAWRCELTSVPAKGSVSPAFGVLLTFFSSPSAAIAHANMSISPDPALRLTGADEARARELHDGGGTTTRVTWRKGRYWGWFSIHGPKLVGDLDDARDLLGGFVRLLPRT